MGLGKTIQAIAATEILARHFGLSKVLVICPTALKYQWQSEIARFSGRQGRHAARVISGGRAQRSKDYALDDFCKITNYEKLKPDIDLIAAWAPELVIVDEAQRVKNWNTIAARALKRIDSSYAFVLTGTPLENKLEELVPSSSSSISTGWGRPGSCCTSTRSRTKRGASPVTGGWRR